MNPQCGVGGDNWNIQSVIVRTAERRSRALYRRSANPLFRFTGKRRAFTIRL